VRHKAKEKAAQGQSERLLSRLRSGLSFRPFGFRDSGKLSNAIDLRTCGASAKRGHLASPISARSKFFWLACSFWAVACLAPFLRRNRPHSARAGAALPHALVRHARRTVRSVATRREVHRAAHAADDVCSFARSESQPVRFAHGPRTLHRIACAGKAKKF